MVVVSVVQRSQYIRLLNSLNKIKCCLKHLISRSIYDFSFHFSGNSSCNVSIFLKTSAAENTTEPVVVQHMLRLKVHHLYQETCVF